MVANKPTRSERLFEELCNAHGIKWTRLAVFPNRKQPDYELALGSQLVVVEVKQIEPNPDDRSFSKALRAGGVASQCRDPDKVASRVRNHIKESRSQLKAYLDYLERQHRPKIPSLLILFDNADNRYTDPYTIQVAMHGFERVQLEVPRDGSRPVVVDRGFAPRNNKTIGKGKNNHLSAVVTLHEFEDLETCERRLGLRFFHNPSALCRFDPLWWQGKNVLHRVLEEKTPGQFQNWRTELCGEDGTSVRGGR